MSLRSSILSKARQWMIFLAAVNPITKKTRNSNRNKPARNLAIAIAKFLAGLFLLLFLVFLVIGLTAAKKIID